MLAAATTRPVIASEAATGTSIGAALLASDQGRVAQGKGERTEPPADPAWVDYVRSWRAAVDADKIYPA